MSAIQLARRDFLRKTAAAGCCVAMRGIVPASESPSVTVTSETSHPRLAPGCAEVVVVTASVSTDANPRAATWGYLTEILQRAGLFFENLSPSQLGRLSHRRRPVVLLAGDLPLDAKQRDTLAGWIKQGGLLVGIGGTSGLDDVFGVKSSSPLAEGWIKVGATEHPVTRGLRSSLHVFGGCTVKAASATSLAEVELANHTPRGSAIVEHRFGRGRTLLLGPDLVFSVVHIQQGRQVLQDGRAAPDGLAAIDEGVLKAEDGLVLDWERDRVAVEPDGGRLFLEPISDELRELILRSVFHLAAQEGLTLPLLWYWPRGLKAVGLMSHDTDGNDPQKATALLETMQRCGIVSTWCLLYPGGYPPEFYRALKRHGFEIGLHYDAMTGGARTSWSKENFLFQHRWLLKTAELERIDSNKNHYTRWEGRLDLLRWGEAAGVHSDETRGPSKKGTIGFPLGGSQPYFPLDDEAPTPRALHVLEVNLLTQDLLVTCPPQYGRQLVDSALRHHGVGHFLFHPAHILKPGVAEALGGLVDYGRAQGLEWWTNRQIYHWEMLRRGVEATHDPLGVTLRTPVPVPEATLLLLKPRPEPRSITVDGRQASSAAWQIYGFEFDAVKLDLDRKARVQWAV